MRKALKIILLVTFVLSLAFSAVACGTGSDDSGWNEVIQKVYADAKELGYEGTIDDFIKQVSGKDGINGKDGITPEFDVENGELRIRYGKDGNWEVLCQIGTTKGDKGDTGAKGDNGQDGVDGITPQLRINSETNEWEVSYDSGTNWTSLNVKATGADGQNGANGQDGAQGAKGDTGAKGENGKDGENGVDGITPQLRINDETNEWEVSYDSGTSWTSLNVKATGADGRDGAQGAKGDTGAQGEKGEDGKNGENGKTPQLKVENGILKVSYDDVVWKELGEIKGKSAYEIYKEYFDYSGTEEEWIIELINGTLIEEESKQPENKTFENIFSNMNMETGFSVDTDSSYYNERIEYTVDTGIIIGKEVRTSEDDQDYADIINLKFKKTKDMAYYDQSSYSSYDDCYTYLIQRKSLSGEKEFKSYSCYGYYKGFFSEGIDSDRVMTFYAGAEYLSTYGKQFTTLLQKLGGEFVYNDGAYVLSIKSNDIVDKAETWINGVIDSLTYNTTVEELYNNSGIRQFILDCFSGVKVKDVVKLIASFSVAEDEMPENFDEYLTALGLPAAGEKDVFTYINGIENVYSDEKILSLVRDIADNQLITISQVKDYAKEYIEDFISSITNDGKSSIDLDFVCDENGILQTIKSLAAYKGTYYDYNTYDNIERRYNDKYYIDFNFVYEAPTFIDESKIVTYEQHLQQYYPAICGTYYVENVCVNIYDEDYGYIDRMYYVGDTVSSNVCNWKVFDTALDKDSFVLEINADKTYNFTIKDTGKVENSSWRCRDTTLYFYSFYIENNGEPVYNSGGVYDNINIYNFDGYITLKVYRMTITLKKETTNDTTESNEQSGDAYGGDLWD